MNIFDLTTHAKSGGFVPSFVVGSREEERARRLANVGTAVEMGELERFKKWRDPDDLTRTRIVAAGKDERGMPIIERVEPDVPKGLTELPLRDDSWKEYLRVDAAEDIALGTYDAQRASFKRPPTMPEIIARLNGERLPTEEIKRAYPSRNDPSLDRC